MDETIDQIEAHIDQTQQRLGSNVQELERRLDAAIDWREQFRARPYVALGMPEGWRLRPSCDIARRAPSALGGRPPPETPPRNGSDAWEQAIELWNNIKRALIGVATTRVRDYIGEVIPDFQEHFQSTSSEWPRLGAVASASATFQVVRSNGSAAAAHRVPPPPTDSKGVINQPD
jgi:hypothetical protein